MMNAAGYFLLNYTQAGVLHAEVEHNLLLIACLSTNLSEIEHRYLSEQWLKSFYKLRTLQG